MANDHQRNTDQPRRKYDKRSVTRNTDQSTRDMANDHQRNTDQPRKEYDKRSVTRNADQSTREYGKRSPEKHGSANVRI